MGTKSFRYGRTMENEDRDFEFEVYSYGTNFVDENPMDSWSSPSLVLLFQSYFWSCIELKSTLLCSENSLEGKWQIGHSREFSEFWFCRCFETLCISLDDASSAFVSYKLYNFFFGTSHKNLHTLKRKFFTKLYPHHIYKFIPNVVTFVAYIYTQFIYFTHINILHYPSIIHQSHYFFKRKWPIGAKKLTSWL